MIKKLKQQSQLKKHIKKWWWWTLKITPKRPPRQSQPKETKKKVMVINWKNKTMQKKKTYPHLWKKYRPMSKKKKPMKMIHNQEHQNNKYNASLFVFEMKIRAQCQPQQWWGRKKQTTKL